MTIPRILVVDDEMDIALILKLHLEDAGYRTVRARDGVEALEAVARETFDLILLDIRMPRMDGMQVLDRLIADFPQTAVVMMTAHGSEDIAVQAMKKGAVDYISKPFSTDDLLKRVERAIQFNRTRLENIRLQEEVAEERQKMEAILEGMTDLLIAVDSNDKVMTVNSSAARMLGIDRNKVVGRDLDEIVSTDSASEALPCRVALRTGSPCLNVEYVLRTAEGSIPVLSNAAPLIGSSGAMIGCVEIIRDISSLKALEQEREDFVSMLSHDLKSPITAVVGSIGLVHEGRLGPVNEEQTEYLDAALESCTEMVEMIDTLLDVHKFEAGKMVMTFRPEDPQQLILRAVNRYRPVARRAQMAFHATLPHELPMVRADRLKFDRLLNNLLSNAFKFTPDGGEIEVRGELVPGREKLRARLPIGNYPEEVFPFAETYLQVAVRDTGEGIPPDSLGAIFDRYVQVRLRKEKKSRGTGLGLTFCRRVMDVHEGFIWAESGAGAGSTFFVVFPLEAESGAI